MSLPPHSRPLSRSGQTARVVGEGDLRDWAGERGLTLREAYEAALADGVFPESLERNFPCFSAAAQLRLFQARVLIVGLGGLGGTLTALLARLGVGRLLLADGDEFSAAPTSTASSWPPELPWAKKRPRWRHATYATSTPRWKLKPSPVSRTRLRSRHIWPGCTWSWTAWIPWPRADKHTLVRRVYLDLIGLPPTPEEADAFVNDAARDAYERLVDKLLASPHYGERWARHWLDVVRFAETTGFEVNTPRPNAWPYRDYVIRAFNEDKPYDQFIREQLAGDVLGEDAATGFLVAGLDDLVKSPDPVLTSNQRADELHDMVSTTGCAFLGLTVGCARCHSHKFDPIPQTDYFGLKAVFEGVKHGERKLKTVETDKREKELAQSRHEDEGYCTVIRPLAPTLSLREREKIMCTNWRLDQ